jgi:pyruvate kinase
MLSAETASGRWPVKTIEAMARVCEGAERAAPPRQRSRRQLDTHFGKTDEAVAMATAWTAQHMHARAIIALTESGNTAMMMSRTESEIPIFALTKHERTRRRMGLCRGVYPVPFEPLATDAQGSVREAIECLKYRQAITPGDRVLVTHGDRVGGSGGTNSMTIVTVT